MLYGKVKGGEIVAWMEVASENRKKIQTIEAKGYLPEEDIPPVITKYQRVKAVGHNIMSNKIVKLYEIISKSQQEIDAIDEQKLKAQEIEAVLPSWLAVSAAVDNISTLSDAKIFLKKLSRVIYWHVLNKAD